MKFFTKLLPAALAVLLTSCAGDVMQVMVEEKQPVGVLVIRPPDLKPASSHLETAGPTYTAVKDQTDPATPHGASFGRSVVAAPRRR